MTQFQLNSSAVRTRGLLVINGRFVQSLFSPFSAEFGVLHRIVSRTQTCKYTMSDLMYHMLIPKLINIRFITEGHCVVRYLKEPSPEDLESHRERKYGSLPALTQVIVG